MTKPRILTAEFWGRRLDAATDNVPRMIRTGAQFVIGALGISDATPIDAFALDWRLVGGSFVGGCVVWVITTLATPPAD
jgi:hypothetical protein